MFYQVNGKVIVDDENENDGSLECCCAVGCNACGGGTLPVVTLRSEVDDRQLPPMRRTVVPLRSRLANGAVVVVQPSPITTRWCCVDRA